jgi:acetyl esterase/lipase
MTSADTDENAASGIMRGEHDITGTGPLKTHTRKPAGRGSHARAWTALAAAVVTASIAIWIVVPARTATLLVVGVAAAELSAWLVAFAAGALVLALIDVRRRIAARAAVAIALAAIGLALRPLLQVPATIDLFDARMIEALGRRYLDRVPDSVRAAMREDPIALVDLFRGVDAGAARVTRGIRFSAPGDVPLTMDIYRPTGAGIAPVVVLFYPGAWQRGVPGANRSLATYLASHGYAVFALDYRHAPRWQWPAQIEDVRAALGWLRDHAAGHGGDMSRIAFVGRSAGAHLAMVAAYERGAPPVRAIVNLYGPVDLAGGYREPPSPDPLEVRSLLEDLLGGAPDEMPGRYRAASPISYVTLAAPPTLSIYGARDHVVEPRWGALLHERLRSAGATSVLLEIPWSEHAFDLVPQGPGAQIALYYIERFLAWALRSR